MNQQFFLQNNIVSTKQLLATAQVQLREILEKLKSNVPVESVKSTDELNKLFGFGTNYEAKILASRTVGDSISARQMVVDLTHKTLSEAVLLSDFIAGKTSLTQGDLQDFSSLKLVRDNSMERINLAARIATSGSQTNISEVKDYSVDKLLQQITRTVAINEDFDMGLNILLSALVYEVHKDESVLPLILKDFNLELVRSYSYDIASSQTYRDQVGASLVPLVKRVAKREVIELFDEDFVKAYNATAKFVERMYTTVITENPQFKRNEQEVDDIKKALFADVKMPEAPVSPRNVDITNSTPPTPATTPPPPPRKTEANLGQASQPVKTEVNVAAQSNKTKTIPENEVQPNKIEEKSSNAEQSDKATPSPSQIAQPNPSVPPAPKALDAPSAAPKKETDSQFNQHNSWSNTAKKGIVPVRRVERKSPPSDSARKIQSIDLN